VNLKGSQIIQCCTTANQGIGWISFRSGVNDWYREDALTQRSRT
jgi:hypothetical protein